MWILLPALLALGVTAKTVLNVASVDNGDLMRMKSHLDDFYAKNPDLEVKFNFLDENIVRNEIINDIVSTTDGGKYDVIVVGMYEVPIWAKKGWLLPLEDMPESYEENDLIPAVKDALSYDNKLYASPFYGESSFIMYRKDIIEDMPEQPSWGEVYNYAKKYHKRRDLCKDPENCPEGTDKDFLGICLRGKAGWGENGAFLTTLVNAFGGRWFDEDWVPQLDGSEWNAAISFYVDLMQNYGAKGAYNFGFSENLLNFQQGKCLMWIDATVAASWLTESPPWGFVESDPCFGKTSEELTADDGSLKCTPMWKKIDKCGFAKAPLGQWRKAGWLWSWNIAIPGGSKKLAETRKFVDWATNKDYIELVANATGRRSVPPGTRVSTYENEDYKKIDFATKTLDAMKLADPTKETGTMRPKPYIGVQFAAIPEFQEIGGIVGEQLSLALEGKKSVADALSSAQASTVLIMQRAGHLKVSATKADEGNPTTMWGRTVITKNEISGHMWSTALYAADVNKDGLDDLVAVGDPTKWVGYFKNLGKGQGFAKDITPLVGKCETGSEEKCAFGANSAVVVDGNVIYSAVDQGNYKFSVGIIKGSDAPVILMQNVIMGLSKVAAADVDGDGLDDIIVAGASVGWMKNLGSGKFGDANIIGSYGATDVEAVDIDGDGDVDIVGGTTGGPGDNPRWKGIIFLLENDGSGKFTESVISDGVLRVSGVTSIPRTDGTSGVDIVSASTEDSTVALHYKTAAGWEMMKLTDKRCGEMDLSTKAPEVMALCAHFASDVVAFDADGDGDLDLAVASRNDNSISWFKNNGDRSFSTIQRLDSYAEYASSVVALDADGDGSVDDLASSSQNSVSWYHNTLSFEIYRGCPITSTNFRMVSNSSVPVHGQTDLFTEGPQNGETCGENLNYVGDTVKTAGYLFMAINITLALAFGVWTFLHWRAPVVRAGQPIFLMMISLGAIISSLTIYFLGIDDEGLSNTEGSNSVANSACMLSVWFYSVGFVLTFAPLFVKLWLVKKIFTSVSFAVVKVKRSTLMGLIFSLLLVDTIVLGVWSASDDTLVLKRVITGTYPIPSDYAPNLYTEIVTESVGLCQSDGAWNYISVIVVFHLALLIFGNVLGYQCRSVPTKFSEAKYITLAMISNFQVLALSVPILYIVSDNASTNFFIRSGIIFLNDCTTQCLIFGPKILAHMFPDMFPQMHNNATSATQKTNNTQPSYSSSASSTGKVAPN